MVSPDVPAPLTPIDAVVERAPMKGLKGGALGLVAATVIGVASTAPAYSLAATLGFIVALVVFALDQLAKWAVTHPLGINQIGDQLVHAKPGTYVFIPPGVPHNIANASDKPARMIMTVSPPGHEHYFEELVKLVASSNPPDADAIAALRSRYDTEQLSALKRT